MRCTCVSPHIAQGLKSGTTLGNGGQDVQKIPGGTCKPIEPGDNHLIALAQTDHQTPQLVAVSLCSASVLRVKFRGRGLSVASLLSLYERKFADEFNKSA